MKADGLPHELTPLVSRGRIPVWDGLRGIAILLVLLYHGLFSIHFESAPLIRLTAIGKLSLSGAAVLIDPAAYEPGNYRILQLPDAFAIDRSMQELIRNVVPLRVFENAVCQRTRGHRLDHLDSDSVLAVFREPSVATRPQLPLLGTVWMGSPRISRPKQPQEHN